MATFFDDFSSMIESATSGGAVTGGTATTSADFNCTRVPGVCKPTNQRALGIVQEAQHQLSRVAKAKGWSGLSYDGDVGPGTLALAKKVIAASGGTVVGNTSSAAALSLQIGMVGAMSKAFADRLGAPAQVKSGVLLTTPSIIPPGASAPVAVPSAGTGVLDSMLGPMTGTQKALLGVMGVGILYKLMTRSKKKGGRR